MNLITFSFVLEKEKQDDFFQSIAALKAYWEEKGVIVSLYRDATETDRFFQLFFTERSVDEVTALIHENPLAADLFRTIRDSGSRVILSVQEQIL